MNKLKITWKYDEHECETCGYTYAEGARVELNGQPLLDLLPVATCFGSENDWSTFDVFAQILLSLGYEVEYASGDDN